MAANSSIEWTDHTVSFWWGCEKISPACKFCYAASIDHRFGPKLDFGNRHWGAGAARLDRRAYAETLLEDVSRKARRTGDRPKIFINSMSDWLDPEVPIEWLADALATMAKYSNVTKQLLTKRPELWKGRIQEVAALGGRAGEIADAWLAGEAPAGFWIGGTVENPERAELVIDPLTMIPAEITYLSIEPLLAPLRLNDLCFWPGMCGCLDEGPGPENCSHCNGTSGLSNIDWVIAGGESGNAKGIRPSHPDWFRSLRDECAAVGVPFFFKQWGEWVPAEFQGGPSLLGATIRSVRNLGRDGIDNNTRQVWPPGNCCMVRVGKAKSGRLLDGREHSEFPQLKN